MFTRQRRNYRVFVYTALIVALCALVVALFWPKDAGTGEKTTSGDSVGINSEKSTEKTEVEGKNIDSQNDYDGNVEDKSSLNTQEEDSKDGDDKKTVVGNQIQSYYLVKKDGGSIKVFFSNSYGELIELEETQIVYDVLPPEDQKAFEVGIKASNQEELSLLLQDFES